MTDQSKLVSYTDTSSEQEDLHVDVNFDEPIDLAINQFSVFKIEFHRNKQSFLTCDVFLPVMCKI